MLRYSFLPSDFHPMVLILGDPIELRVLGEALRRFAHSPADFGFAELPATAPSDTTIAVALETDAARLGMHRTTSCGKHFRWSLAPYTAGVFAEMIDDITGADHKSGSEMLLSNPHEVPVKLSFGEFTDDFLVLGRPHPPV